MTLAVFAYTQTVAAGVEKEKNATTDEEREEATVMIAAGAALMASIIGIPAGLPLVIADNQDGSRSCWMKVLDDKDITDPAAYEEFKRHGLPVDELLKHANLAVYPPATPHGRVPRVIVRNRHGRHYHVRPTSNQPAYMMYHAEEMPKLLTAEAASTEASSSE